MSFFGLAVSPGKVYSKTVEESFCVTMAALGPTAKKRARTSLVIVVDNTEFVACTLNESRVDQQALNLRFVEGSEIGFRVVGDEEIHLTGFVPLEAGGGGGFELEDGNSDGDFDPFSMLEEDLESGSEAEDDVEKFSLVSEEAAPPSKVNGKKRQAADGEERPSKRSRKETAAAQKADKAAAAAAAAEKQAAAKAAAAQKEKEAAEERKRAAAARRAAAAEAKAAKKAAAKAERQEKAAKAQAAAEAEAKKKSKPEKKLLSHNVTAEILQAGAGKAARKEKKVRVQYKGWLQKTKEVFDQGQISFFLGRGEVIKGWDIGVLGMKVGERRRLTIPSDVAYGRKGAGRDIPPFSTLVFEVQLLSA